MKSYLFFTLLFPSSRYRCNTGRLSTGETPNDAAVCFSWPSCCILTQRERRHATWSVLVDTSSTSHHVEENAGLHLSTRIVLQLISVVIIFNNAVTHWLIRKAMARIIRHRARREHITSVLSEMHWLAVWCLVHFNVATFLPRCMECRRGLAMRILSVSLSVRTSNAWYVTKWNKDLSRFFMPYERSFSLVFWEEEWLVGGATLLPEIWVKLAALEWNRQFSIYFRSWRLSRNT